MRFKATMLAAAVLAALPCACGDGAGELQVIERREPKSLLRQGSAVTDDEVERRRQEQDEKAKRAEAQQRFKKVRAKLERAETEVDLIEALGWIADLGDLARGAAELIEPHLESESGEVRAQALRARAAASDEALLPLIRRALKDDEDLVRRIAVSLLGKHFPDQIDPLVELLSDFDPMVEFAALEALTAEGKRVPIGALDAIAEAVGDMSAPSAKLGFGVLLRERERLTDITPVIVAMLDHQDETARLSAIDRSIGAKLINKPIAEKVVQTMVEDPSESVRKGCLRWLKELAPEPPPEFDPAGDDEARWDARPRLMEWVATLK